MLNTTQNRGSFLMRKRAIEKTKFISRECPYCKGACNGQSLSSEGFNSELFLESFNPYRRTDAATTENKAGVTSLIEAWWLN